MYEQREREEEIYTDAMDSLQWQSCSQLAPENMALGCEVAAGARYLFRFVVYALAFTEPTKHKQHF